MAATAALTAAAACGSDGPSAPKAGPPTRVDVTTAPTSSVGAGSSAGTFAVRVVDAASVPVPGAIVTFGTTGAVSVAPTQATTDASGQASTQVTVGTVVGSATVRASVTGVSSPVSAAITVIAAPATKVVVSPKLIRLVAVGDTARVAATAQDQYGNLAGSGAIAFSVVDATLLSVDQTGLIRALRAAGQTFVISTSNGKADTTTVTVLASGSTSCTGLASAMTLPVGGAQVYSGTQYGCVSGTATGAEFAVVAFNGSTDQTTSLPTSITANGVGTPPTALVSPLSPTIALRAAVGGRVTTPPALDERFHLALLESGRTLSRSGGLSRARAARGAMRSISPSGIGAASRAGIPASAKVGDIITLNVSGGVCSSPENKGLRVAAVGSKAIVLADTLNPSGGFVDADYQRFATTFDTLVYPLDVNAFGVPSDFDNNGKVAIIFTRAVNELVDANSGYFVGGFFNPRDLFPKVASIPTDNCAGSNEGEMFYMLVPAPGAGINNVTHTTGFVDSLTIGIIAHEFQHLINAGRRMYVNTQAQDFEEVWLNEGLSHIAEELLYYRESGFAPRQNLTDSTIRINNRPLYPYWKNDAASNFFRLLPYLRSPGANSLYATGDELATRGAIWSFLRYAADQLGPTDGTLWQRMVNSTVTGVGTLTLGFGGDPIPFIRDWNVANFMDDRAGNTNPRYTNPSWHFRDIFANTFLNMTSYPLSVTDLTDNVKTNFTIRGGSSSYGRFSVPAGKDGLLTFTSGGGLPTASLQFIVVRTK